MKNVKHLCVLLFLILLLLLSACSVEQSAAALQRTGEQHLVYLISKSTETDFWKATFAGARAAAAEYNLDLRILGPETEEDYETQNQYIREAIQADADALVFSAIGYEANAAAIDEAAAAGIKIVVIDSDVDSEGVSVRIGTDNVEAGRKTAAAVLSAPYERLVVGILNYDQGSRNGQEREYGLRQVLEEESRVDGIYTVNVLATEKAALQGAVRLREEYPDINVFVGLNEPLAVGAALAAEKLSSGGELTAVCFDTNIDCIDRMRRGTVSALIVQNPYAMGYLGVETARKLINGDESSFDPHSLIDTATTIVSKENMFSTESQKALFPFG